jgi:sn-glycerol 3-phosphate transport system permease protein
VVTYLWLGIAAVVLLFPVLLTVFGGFLPSSSLLHQPPQLFGGDWTIDNYVEAWNQPVVPLAPAFANSLFVGLAIMAGHLVTSCLAAYALVFLRTPLRTPVFWLFLATIMVPYESIVVPNALFIRALGIGDNRLSLVLPFLANGFGVFLLRQAFLQFPRELREAALSGRSSRPRSSSCRVPR